MLHARLLLVSFCSVSLISGTAAAMAAQQDPLRLPPLPRKQSQPAQPGKRVSDKQVFQQLLLDLQASGGRADAVLRRFGTEVRDLPEHLLRAVRSGTPRLLGKLAPVITRFGDAAVGEEIHYQMQVRRLGEATRPLLKAMVQILGELATDRLFDLVYAKSPMVRREAVDALGSRVKVADLQRIESLTRERDRSLQLAGIKLMGHVRHDDARARLVELLSDRATVAAEAVRSLLRHGQDAVVPLQKVLTGPPMDRSYGYAAFALAQLEEQSGRDLIPGEAAETMLLELDHPEMLERVLVAFGLERLAFRSQDADPEVWRDREIVGALLEVAAPIQPSPNLGILGAPAGRALARFTGRRDIDGVIPWRDWFAQRNQSFLGLRRSVELDAENAAGALLTLRRGDQSIRLVGEGLPAVVGRTQSMDVMLAAEELFQLVQDCKRLGMGAPKPDDRELSLAERSGAATQTLILERGGIRAAVSATLGDPWFGRLVTRLEKVFEEERWQLYGDPAGELDVVEFWHRERRWRAANPGAEARSKRLVSQIVAYLERFSGEGAAAPLRMISETRAVQHLLEVPKVAELLDESDAARLVALVGRRGLVMGDAVDPARLGLLELAMSTPAEGPWRAVLDQVAKVAGDTRLQPEIRDQLLGNLFRVIGTERLVAALEDSRSQVRLAAAQQAAEAADRSAVEPLLGLLDDESLSVRRATVYALGRLRAGEARKELAQRLQQPDAEPGFRRDALVALGRIGGPGVADFLANAFVMAGDRDRSAILSGLGEMRDPRAAGLLAELFMSHQGGALGELAEAQLERQGPLLAGPALLERLDTRNVATRRKLARILGRFQEPQALPDLIEMLDGDGSQLETVLLIEGITGVDLARRNQRAEFMRQWYSVQRNRSQAAWFLSALRETGVVHSLTTEQLVEGAGMAAVPELARLLTDATAPRLRVLASKLLRDVTQIDYGVVTPGTPSERLLSVADRYRNLAGATVGPQAADRR